MLQSEVSQPELEAAVMGTGLWDGGRRHGNHQFVLSPQCYSITAAQKAELDALSKSLHVSLLGISRLMAIAADSGLRASGSAYGRLHRMLGNGAPYNFAGTRPSNIPLVCKVDLVVDEAGSFWIAEADATNPRSWGYSVAGRRLCELIAPTAEALPGVVPYLAKCLKSQRTDEVTFLYGNTQRFYAPEFAIVAAELKAHGIQMIVANEVDIEVFPDALVAPNGQFLSAHFIDLPPMNRNKPLIDHLSRGYRERWFGFVIPPKHFLSSKTLLAVVANSDCDEGLEALLQSQIAIPDLELVRGYLPSMHIIRRGGLEAAQAKLATGQHLLKQGFASGMKGVWFPEDEGFDAELVAAAKQDGAYVLQREIPQKPHQWITFDPSGEPIQSDGWYLRLTGYFSPEGMKDLAITARQDKRVHGNRDAIVTGTLIA